MYTEGTEDNPLKAKASLPKLSKRNFREVAASGVITEDIDKVISSNSENFYESKQN